MAFCKSRNKSGPDVCVSDTGHRVDHRPTDSRTFIFTALVSLVVARKGGGLDGGGGYITNE